MWPNPAGQNVTSGSCGRTKIKNEFFTYGLEKELLIYYYTYVTITY